MPVLERDAEHGVRECFIHCSCHQNLIITGRLGHRREDRARRGGRGQEVRTDADGMEMHPDLVKLRAQYERIVADYTAGHLDDDTAKHSLLSMGVFDASGARWSINLDGMFVRQKSPQAPVEVVNPTMFAYVHSGGAAQPGRAPWEEAREAGVPFARPVQDPGPPQPSMVERASERLRERTTGLQGGRVGDFVRSNRTTVIIAVVLIVLVFVAKLTAGGSDTTSTVATIPASSVTAPGDSSSTPGAAIPVIDVAGAQTALGVLSDRAGAATTLGAKGALNAAFWRGLTDVGVTWKVESVNAVGATAESVVLLSDTTTGAELGRVAVKLAVADGTWRVAEWPDISGVIGR